MPLYHICFEGSVGLAAITFKAFFQCVITAESAGSSLQNGGQMFFETTFFDPVHAPVYRLDTQFYNL